MNRPPALRNLTNTMWQNFGRCLMLVAGLLLGFSATAESAGGSGSETGSRFGDSWQEEVLLHDGRTIVVDRSQSYGGGHEIGQRPPERDMTISFSLPGVAKRITWFSEYGEDLGRSNFTLAALHVLNDTPYVVALPNLCMSYNKWGRPNPPYVIFKYQKDAWTRIPMAELPAEFRSTNLVVEAFGNSAELSRLGKVSTEKVKQLNQQLTRPEYREIIREPKKGIGDSCPAMISYGKQGGWLSLDWFTAQPNLEACQNFCEFKKVSSETCPCRAIFGEK